jgi:hypothetical protein
LSAKKSFQFERQSSRVEFLLGKRQTLTNVVVLLTFLEGSKTVHNFSKKELFVAD